MIGYSIYNPLSSRTTPVPVPPNLSEPLRMLHSTAEKHTSVSLFPTPWEAVQAESRLKNLRCRKISTSEELIISFQVMLDKSHLDVAAKNMQHARINAFVPGNLVWLRKALAGSSRVRSLPLSSSMVLSEYCVAPVTSTTPLSACHHVSQRKKLWFMSLDSRSVF
jgi:hypothetical protein